MTGTRRRSPHAKPLSIGLIHHGWTNPNLGVVALSICSLQLLEEAAVLSGLEIQVTAINGGSGNDLPAGVTPLELTISLRPIRGTLAWFRALRAFSRFDLVVDTGEGDGFSDIYGLKRLLWQVFLKAAALTTRTPLVLAPQTVGPFESTVGRRIARWVSRGAVIAVARDAASFGLLRRAGARSPLLTADMAFSLKRDEQWTLPPGDQVRVGVNVSGLLWYATARDAFHVAGYRDTVTLLIERLSSLRDVEIHLIGHVGAPALGEADEKPDAAASQELARSFPALVIAPVFPGPSAAKGYISSMGFFIGSRMHACIAAASSGVPLAALSYSRKFAGAFGAVGLDVTVDPSGRTKEAIVTDLIHRYEGREAQLDALQSAQSAADKGLDAYVRAVAAILSRQS